MPRTGFDCNFRKETKSAKAEGTDLGIAGVGIPTFLIPSVLWMNDAYIVCLQSLNATSEGRSCAGYISLVMRGAIPWIMSSRMRPLLMSVISLAKVHFKYSITVLVFLIMVRLEIAETAVPRTS